MGRLGWVYGIYVYSIVYDFLGLGRSIVIHLSRVFMAADLLQKAAITTGGHFEMREEVMREGKRGAKGMTGGFTEQLLSEGLRRVKPNYP